MTRLSELICSQFYHIHRSIKDNRHTHYWLKGGRGSTKSSFVSIEIILGMVKDHNANAVAMRKIGANIKNSIFEQLKWAVSILGLDEYWQIRLSPPEMEYIPTGQKIIFRGADDTKKIKSIKFTKGYPKFIWYEEVDEFNSMEEIRSINQSLMRGGDKFFCFYSYNPPKSQKNWVNAESLKKRKDKLLHHSTYLKVPKSWLGEQFIIEAQHVKKVNKEAYEHEYMGKATGTGGEVFKNLNIRRISDEEINGYDRLARGIDWGYAFDPFHYTVNHYDRKRRRLYIFFEIQKKGLSNYKAYEMICQENKYNEMIICDSAEPKSIAEMNGYGLRVIGAKKGAKSVEYGTKWLADLEEIVIDPYRCPKTSHEFLNYEIGRDSTGGLLGGYPDRDNHSIDAIRYSREMDMRNVKVR